MRLVLMRHADAGDPGPQWPDDDLRTLTDLGRSQSLSMGTALARMGCDVDRVLSSPLMRAKQTATIVCEAAGWSHAQDQDLDSFSSSPTLLQSFKDLEVESLAYVGHEPTLSRLISFLLTERDDRSVVEMAKGSCASVDVQGTSATLMWLFVPRAF